MKQEFESGVRYYTTGIAQVKINFPEGEVCCRWCPFCRSEESLKRYWCRLTNEMIYNPYAGIGGCCPVEFEGKEN